MQDKQIFPSDVAVFGETIAPARLAMERDNVGLLVDTRTPVTGVLCALDITRAVVEEAVQKGCNLIVSHHPVIYHPLRAMAEGDVPYLLAQRGVAALCLHTNLDTAQGGVNDVLAGLLGVAHEAILPFGEGMGRVGALAHPVCAAEFLQQCKQALHATLRYTSVPAGRMIRTAAVLGGTGGDAAEAAFAAGADAFITGEAGHHAGTDAVHAGRLLIVAGHFATEYPVVAVLAQKIKAAFPGIAVQQSISDADPFRTL